MARTASRKMMKRSAKRTTKRSPKRIMRKAKRAAPMKRKSTECSRLPASQCNAINPNCQAKKVPGRRTKICVRKTGAKKGMMYEGPSIM